MADKTMGKRSASVCSPRNDPDTSFGKTRLPSGLDPDADKKGWLPSLSGTKRRLIIFGVLTFLALLFANTHYWCSRAEGSPNLVKALWWHAMDWYGWGVLLPAIFWNCRRLNAPISRTGLVANHLAAAMGFALLHGCILTTGARIEAAVFHAGWSWFQLFTRFIFIENIANEIFCYAAITSAWYMFNYYGEFEKRVVREARLESELGRAQLQALRMQLNPHFLFNTLNGISELNYEDPRTANRMLAKLSDLLRLALTENSAQEVSLKQELDFNQRYLELEQLRLGDRLSVRFEISPGMLDALVPTLLLQPLIENAIRHGIAPYSACGVIVVRARRDGQWLHLEVTDNGPDTSKLTDNAFSKGIGLSNIRNRLGRLYGNAHQFRLEQAAGGGWAVLISIPYRVNEVNDAQLNEEYENSHAGRG